MADSSVVKLILLFGGLIGLGIAAQLSIIDNARTQVVLEPTYDAVEALDLGSDFPSSILIAEGQSTDGIEVTVITGNGGEPTTGNYCVLAVSDDVTVLYDSVTQEYTEMEDGEEPECTATSGGWN